MSRPRMMGLMMASALSRSVNLPNRDIVGEALVCSILPNRDGSATMQPTEDTYCIIFVWRLKKRE